MAAPLIQAIRRIVRQAERRLRVDRALARGVALGVPAALLLAGALLTERLRGLPPGGLDWAYAAALGLPLAGLAWGLLTPVRRRHLATRVDTACGLQDRLGTAWAITAGGTRSPADGFPAAAVRDAEGHVDQADAALAVPLRLPGAFRALVLAVLAAAVAAFVPTPELGPTGHLPLLPRERPQLLDEEDVEVQREAATRLQREAREQKDRKLARVADELARLVDRLDGRDVERKHAFERLNKLERKLREGAEETKAAEKAAQEAVKEAAKALKRHEETKPLAEALEKGDLKAAEEALSKLADLMEKAPMTRGLLEKLAKAFEKTAEKLAQRFDSELRKELADEMKRLRELLRKQGLSEREKERLEELRRKLESLDKARESKLGGQQQPMASPERKPPGKGGDKPRPKAGEGQTDPPRARAGMSRMVNRLSRRMEEAAKQLRQGNTQQRQEAQKQAGEELRRGVDEVRNLHRAMRQQELRRKARQRLADLKDALRRGKRQQGASRARRFRQKAQGLRRRGRGAGERQLGKPAARGEPQRGRRGKELKRRAEQGIGAGQGEDRRGGRGRASKTGGKYQEHFVEGQENAGPMLQEVVLDAAEKGFAKTEYREAYGSFRDVAEEELARERIPAGYRHHVKRYFDLIRPDQAAEPGEEP